MTTPVDLTWTTTRTHEDVHQWVSTSVVDVMRRCGYRVRSNTADEVILVRRGPDAWNLLFFSFLASLLNMGRTSQVVFAFSSPATGRTQLSVIGDLPKRVAKVLRELPPSAD